MSLPDVNVNLTQEELALIEYLVMCRAHQNQFKMLDKRECDAVRAIAARDYKILAKLEVYLNKVSAGAAIGGSK